MKTSIVFFIFLMALAFQTTKAQTPNWEWAVQSGGDGSASILPAHICSDNSNNIYVCGSATAQIFLSGGTIRIDSFTNVVYNNFLVKFDKDGKALFLLQVADDSPSEWNIATDSSGNCYVSGNCSKPFILSGGFNVVTGPYIIKLSNDGIIQWVKNFPTSKQTASVNAIASTKFGYLFVTGFFRDTVTFQGKTLINSYGTNSYAIFVASLNPAGDIGWLKKAGGNKHNSTDEGTAICIADDPENPSIYVAGLVREDSTFFDDLFILGHDSAFYKQATNFQGSGFIAKYNGGGKVEWVIGSDSRRGNDVNMLAAGICTDHSGNIYLAGSFDADSGFFNDPKIHTIQKPNSDHNAFLIKFDKSGLIQWLRTNLTATYDEWEDVKGQSVSIDNKDNVYLSGNFVGLTNFNGKLIEIDTPELFHMYIMKFTPDGNETWMLTTGEGSSAQTAFTNNHLYAAGYFGDSLQLGSNLLLSENHPSSQNLFLAQLGNSPSLVNSKPIASDHSFAIFPNPATTNASVNFTLSNPGTVTIEIYDLLGRQVKYVSFGEMGIGEHSEILDLHGLVNGMYVCKVTAGGTVSSEVFTIVK